MKACNVKKVDTFLVTRIPSWKLFSRLEHLCIKRAIMGKIPLKALQSFRRRLRNHLPPPREMANPNALESAHYREQQPKLGQSAPAAHSIPDG